MQNVGVDFEGALGLKILTSMYDLSNRPPQKPLAAMSSLALPSQLAVLYCRVSPEKG